MLRSYFTWACGMGNTVASIFGKCSLLVLCHLGWCPFVSYLLKFMSVESVMLSNHLILSIPFSFCLQSCSASGSFPVNRLFTSGGQRIGASTSASVLPMNSQGWFPLGLTGLISFQGPLKSLLQYHISKASVLPCSAFFMVQISHLFMTPGKTIALTIRTFVSSVSAF